MGQATTDNELVFPPHEEEKLNAEAAMDEARKIVFADRQDDYGHPFTDFSRTAKIWTGILMEKLKPGFEIQPEEVALMMVGLKISRECNKEMHDNIVDSHGYLLTYQRVLHKREELEKAS